MNFHADVRWHNFANIILCSAHLWYLYYFHDGKIGHFNDLFFYNAKTISHLIAQRESHKSYSYHSCFNHPDLESWLFVMFWNAYLCFTSWILNDLVMKTPKMLDIYLIEFCKEFDERKSDFSSSNFSHVICWQYCSFRSWFGNQRIHLKTCFWSNRFCLSSLFDIRALYHTFTSRVLNRSLQAVKLIWVVFT